MHALIVAGGKFDASLLKETLRNAVKIASDSRRNASSTQLTSSKRLTIDLNQDFNPASLLFHHLLFHLRLQSWHQEGHLNAAVIMEATSLCPLYLRMHPRDLACPWVLEALCQVKAISYRHIQLIRFLKLMASECLGQNMVFSRHPPTASDRGSKWETSVLLTRR